MVEIPGGKFKMGTDSDQAMANENVGFSLDIDGRRIIRLPPEHPGPQGRLARLSAVLGRDFQDNAIEIDQTRDGVRLTGFAGHLWAWAVLNAQNSAAKNKLRRSVFMRASIREPVSRIIIGCPKAAARHGLASRKR